MFGALVLREQHCFLNRCRLLKLCSPPFFGQAQHLTNFRRTKPPSGPKGKRAGRPWSSREQGSASLWSTGVLLNHLAKTSFKERLLGGRDLKYIWLSYQIYLPFIRFIKIGDEFTVNHACIGIWNIAFRVSLTVPLGPGMHLHCCLCHGVVISRDKYRDVRTLGYSCRRVNTRGL